MERDVMWVPSNGSGLEHLHLVQQAEAILADGLIIGVDDNPPFRARYTIRCDARWRVREVRVEPLGGGTTRIDLRADGAGYWTNASGDPIPSLDGSVDVDISATPFTNTLPIRRLGLQPGESAELTVAYIAVPAMQLQPMKQRYTCLELTSGGGRYRYEGPLMCFEAVLPVDADGLVIDYPELFARVWPR